MEFKSNILATGTITGSNLSGTNTGDQDLSGYLLTTGKAADSNLLDGINSTSFLRSDANDETNSGIKTWFGGALDSGSSARIQINGFQRTGNIYLHSGGNAPDNVRNSDYLNNISGDLHWNKNAVGNGKIWTSLNDGSGSGLDADLLDGQHASAFAPVSHTHTWASIPNNSVNGWGGLRHTTPSGYIDFGPANSGHAHIYTDRPNFYLNKSIQVLGVSIMNQNDIRSKIFYDVDNTGYYLHPASTSNFNTLNVSTINRNPVVTLSGDVSGSATMTNLGSINITATVANDSHTHSWSNITGKPSTFTPSSHNHDDRYYTESEADSRFVNVAGDTMTGKLVNTNGLELFYNDHSSGPVWDTFVYVGKTDNASNHGNTAPIYQQDGSYGLHIQANSDGAFFGIEPTGSGGYNAVIKWGDDSNSGEDLFIRHADDTYVAKFTHNAFYVDGSMYASGNQRVFADNYHPNADKWTTARSHTVTLTGDVTGSASQSVDGTGNKTWTINTNVGNAETIDGYNGDRFFRRQTKTNATVGGGWITVATCGSGRHSGEVIVTDADSGDHAYIRIAWMRSYSDSNFTVINTGGHQNRITGARVLYQTSDNTYGVKLLQVYVTASSNYEVNVYELGDIADYGVPTAVTPVVENTKTGYALHGSELLNLDTYGLSAEEGIQAGSWIRSNTGFKVGSNDVWHAGNFNPSSYLTTSGKAADSNLLDGIDSSSFLRSDANDTFTGTITMGKQHALVANNYGRGVYGLYHSYRYQHVWSMGTAYNLSDGGTSAGNLYGISWTHSNVGGESISGLGHQMLIMSDGDTRSAIGDGVWSKYTIQSTADLRAPIFYDSNNTGYYVNPASTSVLNHGKFTSTLSFGLYTSGSRGVQFEGYSTHSVVRNDADRLDFYMGNSSGGVGTMMTLTKDGSVGIGTTSPSQKLQVEGSAKFKTVNSTTPTLDLISTNNSDPFLRFYDESNGPGWCTGLDVSDEKYKISFDYDNTTVSSGTKLTIATNGNVGIGTTSPSQKLQVSGNIMTSALYLNNGTSLYLGGTFFGSRVHVSSSGGLSVIQGSTYKPVYASAFTVSSDYRLKSNIVPLDNAISRLNQLEVHRFNWNDRLDEPKVDGFIAHEVATVIPEAVLGEKDGTFEDGSPDYQGIDQAKIVPLLTAALQEALQKIENLETRIQTLENN